MQQRALRILWPAFLMAGVIEVLVFAVVDPRQLHWFGGPAVLWGATTIYSFAFLVFWSVTATSGALTVLLNLTADEINAERAAP